MKRRALIVGLNLALILGIVGSPRAHGVHALIDRSSFCDGTGQSSTGEGSSAQLEVHFDVFIPEYTAACSSGTGLINFLGTGDPAAVSTILTRSRPFGGSDVPLTAAEKQQIELDTAGLRFRRSVVHQIPLYVDGWAVAYNLSCTGEQLKFRSHVLGLIYSRAITQWNDPLLVVDNPSLSNCNQQIKLTRRSEPAGATLIFKDYLSKRSPMWHVYKQQFMNTQWPTIVFACQGLGEAGMAGCIGSNQGSIGYVEAAIAAENGLQVGQVENVAGTFAAPSPDRCTKAAESASIPAGTPGADVDNPLPPGFGPDRFVVAPNSPTMADWSAVSITDALDGYAICAFSYAFVFQSWVAAYASQVSSGVTRSTIDYLWVAVSDSAQNRLAGNRLGKLPSNVLQVSRAGLESIRFCGC